MSLATMTKEEAKEFAREFSGHENEEVRDYIIERNLPGDLGHIGTLIELQIFLDEDQEEIMPIRFAPEKPERGNPDNVCVAGTKHQIYFLGGDQDYNLELEDFLRATGRDEDDIEELLEKDEVILGPCKAIAYYKSKHHLEGEPKKAITREHQFGEDAEGEEVGEMPTVVYNQRDKEFRLVGGTYTVEAEGITG